VSAQNRNEAILGLKGNTVRLACLYTTLPFDPTTHMMSGEAWLYLIAVLINAVNLFLQVFFTIMYSDLEW
jgi:hypothetical protein